MAICQTHNCHNNATTHIAFAGRTPSSIFCCDRHAAEVLDDYRRLGQPGSICITPIQSRHATTTQNH